MSPAFEIRGQEDFECFKGGVGGGEALAEARDVRVIVTARHLGIVIRPDDRTAGTGNLVDRHRDALAAAAYRNPELSVTVGNRVADRCSVVRVVNTGFRVGAKVDYVIVVLD